MAKIIEELNIIRPKMTGMVSEDDFTKVARTHSRFLTVRLARKHPDLKEKVVNIQDSRSHRRLAQELAGRKRLALSTVKTYWKKYKPKKYRQRIRC